MSTLSVLGVPPVTATFLGIDRLGVDCRVAATVTVMRVDRYVDGHGIVCGDRVSLYDGVRLVLGDPLQHPDTGLVIGNDVIINTHSYLSGEGGLRIGDEVLIGSQVQLLSAGHQIDAGDASIWRNPLTFNTVSIGRGSWLAAGTTVLPGVSIGEGAVVGAASVVTRDVPPFAVVAGNPAKVLRYRRGFGPRSDPGWFARLRQRR